MEYDSTSELNTALNQLVDRVHHTYNPDRIYQTLGDDLGKLGLTCVVITNDPVTHQIFHEYHNIQKRWLKTLQHFTGISRHSPKAPEDAWSVFVEQVFLDGEGQYFRDYRKIISSLLPFKTRLSNKPLSAFDIHEDTRGIFLPLKNNQEIFGCLTIWGELLDKSALPICENFAEQISTAIHFAHLQKTRDFQAEKLERSNSLVHALSNVSAKISATNVPGEILSTLGSELKQFQLDCFVFVLDEDQACYINRYASINPELIQKVEENFGLQVDGFSIPREKWDSKLMDAGSSLDADYSTDFIDLLKKHRPDFPEKATQKMLQFAGISTRSPVLIMPLKYQGKRIGAIGFWGDGLQKEDVPLYQVFAGQVAHIFQTARLLEQAQREIQLRKEAQIELEKSRRELRGVFENAHDAIMLVDPESREILDVNDRACSVYGYNRDEFTALDLEALHTNQNHAAQLLTQTIQTGNCNRFETIHLCSNLNTINLEINSSLVEFNGKLAVQCINRDISDRKEYEKKLKYDALHDALTNLPNRDLFRNRLKHAIARLSRYENEGFAVLYIDLDDFKKINDTLGHMAGDRYLIQFSQKLQEIIRESDIAARLGGDEFGVLLEDVHSTESAKLFCSRLLHELHKPLVIDSQEFVVSASIGIVMSSPIYNSPEDYLRNADIAMYESKKRGKQMFTVYSSGMHTGLLRKVNIENKLRSALRNREFFLEYQPIISIQDQDVIGFEALVRWQSPEDGLITPGEFIPIAEETGLIHSLGTWILDKACTQFQTWVEEGFIEPDVSISINISPAQLMHPNFPLVVEQIIKTSGMNPCCLCLEITETAFMTDPIIAERALQAIHKLKVNIHLDDFGTGYSSLSFLIRFPIDTIKIDRKFIFDLGKENNNALVESLILMSRSMGLSLIAEGVETEDQLAILSGMSCEKAQGYYFSRPVAPHLLGFQNHKLHPGKLH